MDDIALVYLAEQTSPDDYTVKNLNIIEKLGAIWASFEAILHSFHVINRNRRMYDDGNVWKCISTSERIQDNLRKRGWYGEQDHPGQDFTNMALTAERVRKIDMNNRSHAIINPHVQKNFLVSTIETCPGTNCGIGMARDLARGLIPSFSCRSIAIMKYRNGKPYVEVKQVITYDWVLYPSHREAEMITSPTFNSGEKKIVLESVSSDINSVFTEYSNDFCVPMSEFEDFKNVIINSDKNVCSVLEFCDDGITEITGFDPKTNNIIVESGRSKFMVNANPETKRMVEDFLTSF